MGEAATHLQHVLSQNNATSSCDEIHCFSTSLSKSPLQNVPFPHYILEELFSDTLIDELGNLPFEAHLLDYNKGTREEFNPFRRYLCPEIIEQHPCAKTFTDIFLHPKIIRQFEEIGGISLKNTLLRAEYAMDTDKFWLAPHTDLGVKKVTLLVYLSRDSESESWGTDIYYDSQTHYKAVPYKANTALLFFASDKTWHGFEQRQIKGVRKSIIVNYVTQEWRNRHELVHPQNPVY